MKRLLVILAALSLLGFEASGQAISMTLEGQQGKAKVVGTFHAQDAYNGNRDLTGTVWAYPSGAIYFDAVRYPYILTLKDRDALMAFVQQGIHSCQIAKENSTTIDYAKDIGEMGTEDGAKIVIRFVTHGWEHSGIEVRFYDAGRNVDLFLTAQDVAEMSKAFSAVADSASDHDRQATLFN